MTAVTCGVCGELHDVVKSGPFDIIACPKLAPGQALLFSLTIFHGGRGLLQYHTLERIDEMGREETPAITKDGEALARVQVLEGGPEAENARRRLEVMRKLNRRKR